MVVDGRYTIQPSGNCGASGFHQTSPWAVQNLSGENRIMEKKLYVGNLSYNTTESQLGSLFAQAGSVVQATLITDRETGRSKGFGFVEMGDERSAAAAISQFNGTQLDGRTIKVSEAKPRVERESRPSRRW